MESKKSDTNELIYKTEIDSQTENKLMVKNKHGYQRGRRGKGKTGSMKLTDTHNHISNK